MSQFSVPWQPKREHYHGPLARLIIGLAKMLDRVNNVIGDQNVSRISDILVNVEVAANDFSKIASTLGNSKDKVDGLLVDLSRLIRDNEGKLSHVTSDLEESLEAVARHVDSIAENLEMATRNLNEFSDQVRRDPSLILRGRGERSEPGGSR